MEILDLYSAIDAYRQQHGGAYPKEIRLSPCDAQFFGSFILQACPINGLPAIIAAGSVATGFMECRVSVMNRRSFLSGLAALVGGVAAQEAIPFGRVWSFPSKIVIPQRGIGINFIRHWDSAQSRMINRFDILLGYAAMPQEGIERETIIGKIEPIISPRITYSCLMPVSTL